MSFDVYVQLGFRQDISSLGLASTTKLSRRISIRFIDKQFLSGSTWCTTISPVMPLAFKSFGEGVPVLFIHGWELNGDYDASEFEPIFLRLTGYRRVYIDLPGMGETPADASIVDLESIYDKIVDFIDHHISPTNFILAGTSLGGYIARALATRFHTQILGLLLKVPLIEADDRRRDIDASKPIIEDRSSMSLVTPTQLSLVGSVIVQTPAYIKSLLTKTINTLAPALEAADNKVLDPIRNDPCRYSLKLIESGDEAVFQKPTLILTGRHDDVVGHRDAFRLLTIYPRATYAVLDRGTHMLPVDEGDLVESLIHDWLKRVAEDVANRML